MILIEKPEINGWAAAIRGMRNAKNSWWKSDTEFHGSVPKIGKNDLNLMLRLAASGGEHRKFMRYITVTFDLTAPVYFWQQMDTYKVGTARNSTSKMHRLLHKEFDLEDFNTDGLPDEALGVLKVIIDQLNNWRKRYFETPQENKVARSELWDAVLRILPESYMQKSTMFMNYEVLRNIYHQRRAHKLGEWHDFCKWILGLPYAELFTEELPGAAK